MRSLIESHRNSAAYDNATSKSWPKKTATERTVIVDVSTSLRDFATMIVVAAVGIASKRSPTQTGSVVPRRATC